ncbi:hypothetical protein CEUSTIGMA_g1471.t1 [Chlamydomonas eustigma]|uniref:Peptidase M11 gametolysin domain-containing protein n=1 Tax=Chlamydomonas eustigma TaxID=1157962 RepID=A0A250WT90_9CHLO|nr:hypothetical protein CEUSTIGMA_g1471.t1 [Chlamydomonas eustigma]|eukprot:GAX74021.1 hypothetical protein CEUSTIGMA_g1471.t1 [Chlamydomonas eustigma]
MQTYIASQPNIDVSLYQHRVLLMPPGTPCSSLGVEGMFYPDIFVLVNAGEPIPSSAFLHEFGHNLGLQHSSVLGGLPDSQEDTSSIMGAAGPMRCYNAPHIWQLGWGQPSNVIGFDDVPAGSWMYERLVPLGSSPNGYIILQPGQYSSPNTFFLSYRIATGCDTNLETQYLNKVSLHMYNGVTLQSPLATDCTMFITMIPLSMAFAPSDPSLGANIVITFVYQDMFGVATVGLCRFISSPSECALQRSSNTVLTTLPQSNCNGNGSCEPVFGENYMNCADCFIK